MGRLCMIMHLPTLCTPCIAFMLLAHTSIIAIGDEEQGLEEPPEPAPVEAGNHEQDKAGPDASNQSLSLFYSSYLLIIILRCALSCRRWIDT
jgi:hypothetical protein